MRKSIKCSKFLGIAKLRRPKTVFAFTLVELLISMGIAGIIAGSILGFLVMSDRSWQIGKDKLLEQQQARMAIDNIARNLQISSPRWQDASGNNYTVTIASGRIDFYIPRFYPACCPDDCVDPNFCIDSGGVPHEPEDIQSLAKVTYKLNPADLTQLFRKEGTDQEVIIANEINNIVFNCGCPGCVSVDDSCPFVDVSVVTEVQTPYNVQSTIALRNANLSLADSVEIEEPEEGEF